MAGYYRSDFSGWFYTANVPLSIVQAPFWQSLRAIGAMAIFALIVSGALTYFVGKSLTEATRGLAARATVLGQGGHVEPLSSSVSDFIMIAEAMVAADDALSERTHELQAVLETAPVAVWFTYDPPGRQVIRNRFAAELMGLETDSRKTFDNPDTVIDTVALKDGQTVSRGDRPLTKAMRGEQTDNEEFAYILLDGTRRILLSSARSIRNGRGEIVGAVQVSLDITERKRSEEHRKILVRELNHRVKNTLAIVRSIANQTLQGANDLEEANLALTGRLVSLAQAHDILTNENWSGADLCEVRVASLIPQTEIARFDLEGNSVWLHPSLALSLAMAFDELATNAIKYGALSREGGRISISWSVERDGTEEVLRVEWRERGGPPVRPLTKEGFGLRMLKRVLSAEKYGRIDVQFEPAGLIFVFEASLGVPGVEKPTVKSF